jgi:AcrR family transcriptional regulator
VCRVSSRDARLVPAYHLPLPDQTPRTIRKPRQERSRETVRAILDAAEQLTGEDPKGPAMNKLAARAGVSSGTLYEYFACREDVIIALEERAWAQRVPMFFETLSTVTADVAPPVVISKVVRLALDGIREHFRAHGERLLGSNEERATQRREFVESFVDLALQTMARNGVTLRRKNARLALQIAASTVMSSAVLGARDHAEDMDSNAYHDEVANMIIRYLATDDA